MFRKVFSPLQSNFDRNFRRSLSSGGSSASSESFYSPAPSLESFPSPRFDEDDDDHGEDSNLEEKTIKIPVVSEWEPNGRTFPDYAACKKYLEVDSEYRYLLSHHSRKKTVAIEGTDKFSYDHVVYECKSHKNCRCRVSL
jgi:hypothetical protein